MLKYVRYILLFSSLLLQYSLYAQNTGYSVTLTPFSSLVDDEFSPVCYKNGIVFCSNLKNNSLITYQDEQDKLFNIFFVAQHDTLKWTKARVLARELTTNYNEGPATFNEEGDVIYFCRNNDITGYIKNVSDASNKLGIYSAELSDGVWTNIRPFIHNNPWYSFVTPALTPDAKRLYFASDMPGGYGGYDLYFSNWNGAEWDKPVNLGPSINSAQNESYPFAGKSGKLFFASDGHNSLGGKDIFYSQQVDGSWLNPMHLDADINSPYDDFGIVTDDNLEQGYFSSNRRKSDDIFHFSALPVEFLQCDSIVKNNYCFLFFDERQLDNDTVPVTYEWDFGYGVKKRGLEVKHCFPGPGNYEVKLYIVDSLRSDSLLGKSSYKFELKEKRQVYINSPDYGIVGSPVSFDGLSTNLPDFRISDYLWNFGEGFTIRGPATTRVFNKKGEYTVKLGLLGAKDTTGNIDKACGFKRIKIFDDYQELATLTATEISGYDGYHVVGYKKTSGSPLRESAKGESKEAGNTVPLMIYIYMLDDLSAVQKDLIFENLKVAREETIAINDKAIADESYPILLKFVKVLKDNPDLKLEIAVHTDDKGLSGSNMERTEKWAHDLYTFFLENGVSGEALHCKGYGESRPVADRTGVETESINNRIEFIFMSKRY